MRIYNTLTREKEELVTVYPGEVRIYACGPTVYNYIHIGNARPACVFDVLRRYLEYRGYDVKFVQNFTDIDDKIINRAVSDGIDYTEISEKYIAEYKTDAQGLNIMPATVHPRATENMKEILEMIASLIEKGNAYSTKAGDVYFRTGSFSEYGKLSHQPLEELESGARIAVGEIKENPMDFALWKSAKPGEPMWDSPWGKGRPGWHIECSAMSRRYLGETIDIHCGGQDLIFPHHENEIAQSECCSGVPFAKYWMHNGYINVDNRKMSKSLGNFFTVRDVAEKYGYEAIKYMMISSHYRSPINYSTEIIEQCNASLTRLYNCRENIDFLYERADRTNTKESELGLKEKLKQFKQKFIDALDDDLNTADALAVLFEITREINSFTTPGCSPSKELLGTSAELFDELTGVLGILNNRRRSKIDGEIEALIRERGKARAEKNWPLADSIRDELKARNVVLEDTPQGIKWRIEK